MESNLQEPVDIYKLDLEKYGLAYLEGRNLVTLEGADMDKLLKALGENDISLIIPLPCTEANVERMLAYSECRRCGRCCIPNPLNPDSPGVEVFTDELRDIAAYLHLPYETLVEQTAKGKVTLYPFQMTRLMVTRWLPLPCPFYNEKPGECRIYPVRPSVCRAHPIIFCGDESCFAIKPNCDYGKELLIHAFREVRANDPELVIRL